MDNYKITNKKSSKTYFFNEDEMITFFNKNKVQNYSLTNLTEQKRIKRTKMLDTIAIVSFFAATVLSTILIIENYY